MPEQQQDILITIIVASVFFVLLGVFSLVLLFLFLRRQRKNQREKEEMKFKFDKTLLNTQIEIQEQTLSYIASEIHDNIGQILALVRLHIAQLAPETIIEKKDGILTLLTSASSDLRGISHNLKNNSFHQIGLVESVQQVLDIIEKTNQYETSFEYDLPEEADSLLQEKDIILFRMIQEIINNIIKHAAATSISVSMSMKNNQLNTQIKDNGKGFDTSIIKKDKQGIGINNIFERAKLIDTTVDINSSVGNGTIVTLITKPPIK
jgi:two-component system, NarL family, sensor kinase